MGVISLSLEDYKTLEARLYGELTKSCHKYSSELSIISVLGILEIVKQEIRDLDKTSRRFMKDSRPGSGEGSSEEDGSLGTIM